LVAEIFNGRNWLDLFASAQSFDRYAGHPVDGKTQTQKTAIPEGLRAPAMYVLAWRQLARCDKPSG
jgi:hypothetical protein